jgi:predicted amino acid racemase
MNKLLSEIETLKGNNLRLESEIIELQNSSTEIIKRMRGIVSKFTEFTRETTIFHISYRKEMEALISKVNSNSEALNNIDQRLKSLENPYINQLITNKNKPN